MKIPPVGAELLHADGRMDGRTDMRKLTAAYRNFAHALKNGLLANWSIMRGLCGEGLSYLTCCAGSRIVHCGLLVWTDLAQICLFCDITNSCWRLHVMVSCTVCGNTGYVVSASAHYTLRSVKFANFVAILWASLLKGTRNAVEFESNDK